MEIDVNDANFDEEVVKSELPVLVDFWAEWCHPCLMIAPAVEELSREYNGKLKVCKANMDEGPDTASRYGIVAIPTLLLFKQGRVVEQVLGAISKPSLEEKIKPHLKKNA